MSADMRMPTLRAIGKAAIGFIACAGVIAALSPSQAQAPPQIQPLSQATLSEGEAWLTTRVYPRAGRAISELHDQLMQTFARSLWAGGDAVTAADHDIAAKAAVARSAASLAARTLGYDLDADGRVTRREIELALGVQSRAMLRSGGVSIFPTIEQSRRILEKRVERVLVADTDRDGVLTFSEIIAAAHKQLAVRRTARPTTVVPLALDRDGDGKVTQAEFSTAVDAVLGRLDRDRDGLVSPEEAEAWKQVTRGARQRALQMARLERMRQLREQRARQCELPKLATGARLVALAIHEGRAMSGVAIGGDDKEIGVATVEIESGTEPLVILAISDEATIWHITGDKQRVQRFIAASRVGGPGNAKGPRVGVVGLPSDRISFPKHWNCVPSLTRSRSGSSRAMADIETLLGRRPDIVRAQYGVSLIALPSGIGNAQARHPRERSLSTTGPGASMWQEVLRRTPGGIVDLDPKKVLSPYPVGGFKVLPGQAGLAQLLDQGALEPVEPAAGAAAARSFRIVKKMTFPAGLTGGNAVRFVLGKGVDMPAGDPGQSRVVSEETGELLRGGPLRR